MKNIKLIPFIVLSFFCLGIINVQAEATEVYVNGEKVTSTTGTIAYDSSTSTLTLDTTSITAVDTIKHAGIYATGNIFIKLTGDVDINVNTDYCIYSEGSVSVENNHELKCRKGKIYSKEDAMFWNTNVIANGGIVTDEDLEINSSHVTINNDQLITGVKAQNTIMYGSNANLDIFVNYIALDLREGEKYHKLQLSDGANVTARVIDEEDGQVLYGALFVDHYFGTNDYSGISIVGAYNTEGINAYIDEYYPYPRSYDLLLGYTFAKVGNFNLYDISFNDYSENFYYTNKGFKGEKIDLEDSCNLSYYKLGSFKVYKESNGADITNSVLDSNNKFMFTMPDYAVTIDPVIVQDYDAYVDTYKASLYGHDDVLLSWKKDYCDADGYYLYYKKSTSSTYTYLGKTTSNSYKVANLADGVKYDFKIMTYVKTDELDGVTVKTLKSTKSKTKSITTLKKLNKPTITKKKNSKVKVKWNNIEGESGYQIARSTSKSKNYTIVASVLNDITSAKIKTTYNKKYYYKVRAYKKEGNTYVYGPWSEATKFKLK